MIRPIMAKVHELKTLNYHPEETIKLLVDAGNKLELVEAAVEIVYSGSINDRRPPKDYDDVRPLINATLCNVNPAEIVRVLTAKTYCGCIMPIEHAQQLDLERVIAACQEFGSDAILRDVHETLQPYVEEMIIHVNMLSKNHANVDTTTYEKDILSKYFDFFGIWPPETQRGLISKVTQTRSAGVVITAEEMDDGSEWFFCPKDQDEINVDNHCRNGCPFFEEHKKKLGKAIKKCYFKR